jgi:hypothetical protein
MSWQGQGSADPFALITEILIRNNYNPNEVLDDRLRHFLQQLPYEAAMRLVAELESTLRSKPIIRNPTAYLMGVSKRMMDQQGERIRKLAVNEPSMGRQLTPRVLERLRALELDGFCSMSEFNDETFELLGNMSEMEATAAIDELATSDRSRIKTVFGFFNR